MAKGRPLDVERELLESFRQSGLVNEYLVSVLPAAIWHAAPPTGRGRSIAGIVAHLQGVRRTFARMGGARPGPPAQRPAGGGGGRVATQPLPCPRAAPRGDLLHPPPLGRDEKQRAPTHAPEHASEAPAVKVDRL